MLAKRSLVTVFCLFFAVAGSAVAQDSEALPELVKARTAYEKEFIEKVSVKITEKE